MPWLMSKIYDRFMARTERVCLGPWRAELLAGASGRVLEVGAGTGVNLAYYGDDVESLVVSEPDPHMRARLAEKAALPPGTELVDHRLGHGTLPAASFDTVVCTLVLCSVGDPDAALCDLHRALVPGGRLLFLEHVAALDDPGLLRWQHRVEPLWRRLADNCHVTRDTERAIADAGFTIESAERDQIRPAVPWIHPSVRGVAVKE